MVAVHSYGAVPGEPPVQAKPVNRKRIAVILISVAAVAVLVAVAMTSQSAEVDELLTYDEKNAGFPRWSHPVLPAINDRSAVNGRWNYKSSSPPYLAPITLYAGDGVNKHGSGKYVRRLMGVKTQWRYHNWNTNSYISSFESNQMRFFSRNKHSFLVIPPLAETPVLSGTAARYLNDYLLYGGNSLIICGSVSSILFLNMNIPSWDYYGYNLEAKWQAGPYEQQKATIGSRFDKAATTLPGDGVWGVDINTLPKEAISYYEAPGVSVVFALPAKTGKIIYVGYNFELPNNAWAEILQLAVRGSAL